MRIKKLEKKLKILISDLSNRLSCVEKIINYKQERILTVEQNEKFESFIKG